MAPPTAKWEADRHHLLKLQSFALFLCSVPGEFSLCENMIFPYLTLFYQFLEKYVDHVLAKVGWG